MKFLLVALTLALFGCTKSTTKSDRVDISIPSDISTLDPANCFDQVCYMAVTPVYETLYEYEYHKRPYALRPLLAEGMPMVSKDRLRYTFNLKKGIKYHKSEFVAEGREVKARDIVNQIKRLAFHGTRSQGWWLFDGKIKGINEFRDKVGADLEMMFKTEISGVTAPDDNTLVIDLIRPYPQLLFAMAMNFTSPVPEEAIRATNNDLSLKSIGTGAYYITNYNPSQEVILKKNDQYISSVYPSQGDRYAHEHNLLADAGKKLPFVENVRLTVIKEAQTDWLNFMSKKIDVVNLTKDHFPLALTLDGKLKPEITEQKIQLYAAPTLTYWWLSFNMKDPIVGKNHNLRLAIAHGVNNDKFIELFTYNIAQKANSIYPPGVPGYSPSSEVPFKYDVKLAKEYLAKAGYPDGKGLPTLKYDVRGTDTRKRQMGEFIQQELRPLGINIEVRTNTFPAFLEKSRNGELQFWQGGWILDYPDAENVLQLLTTTNLPPGPNSSQYSNPEFDKLFLQVRELEDGDKKSALMKQMENIVNRDLPWAMQYYSRNYVLFHNHLKNYRYSDIINNNIKYLRLEGK